jgi:hypothetical protein
MRSLAQFLSAPAQHAGVESCAPQQLVRSFLFAS